MFIDNIFNINSNDYINVSSILIDNLSYLRNLDDISSAYITSYRNSKYKVQLNITVLLVDNADISNYKNIVNKINSTLSNKINFPILFCVDYESNYNSNVNNSSSLIRIEELLNSDILFDKKGFISSIKNNYVPTTFTYNFDLIEIIPSIGDDLAFRLYKKN